MTGPDAEQVVLLALLEVTGEPARTFLRTGMRLDDGSVDSLALLQVVKILQLRLGIVVPDEATARIRTVGDLLHTVTDLAAEPPPTPPRTAPWPAK